MSVDVVRSVRGVFVGRVGGMTTIGLIAACTALVASAGTASAQLATSRLRFEVRALGGGGGGAGPWSTAITVEPGTTVEFRALVSYTGTVPVFGFFSGAFQPTVSNWRPESDTLQPFRTTGGGPTGGVAANSGEYGRINPFADPGISSSNALRGHTNNVVGGIRYLRIAQNNATNWAGVGAQFGTSQANNFSGSGGVAVAQRAPFLLPAGQPGFEPANFDVELTRFAFTPGSTGTIREMEVGTPAESILKADATDNVRAFVWFNQVNARPTDTAYGAVTILPANVTVIPAPGVLAGLGLAGVLACRRRRA
jgi:hypothetical protein